MSKHICNAIVQTVLSMTQKELQSNFFNFQSIKSQYQRTLGNLLLQCDAGIGTRCA